MMSASEFSGRLISVQPELVTFRSSSYAWPILVVAVGQPLSLLEQFRWRLRTARRHWLSLGFSLGFGLGFGLARTYSRSRRGREPPACAQLRNQPGQNNRTPVVQLWIVVRVLWIMARVKSDIIRDNPVYYGGSPRH